MESFPPHGRTFPVLNSPTSYPLLSSPLMSPPIIPSFSCGWFHKPFFWDLSKISIWLDGHKRAFMVLLLFGARWPRTLAGITAYQSCLQYPFTSGNAGSGHEKQAWRHCDRTGHWEEGDYSHCLYTNDITRVLYTFVLVSKTIRTCSTGCPWVFCSHWADWLRCCSKRWSQAMSKNCWFIPRRRLSSGAAQSDKVNVLKHVEGPFHSMPCIMRIHP